MGLTITTGLRFQIGEGPFGPFPLGMFSADDRTTLYIARANKNFVLTTDDRPDIQDYNNRYMAEFVWTSDTWARLLVWTKREALIDVLERLAFKPAWMEVCILERATANPWYSKADLVLIPQERGFLYRQFLPPDPPPITEGRARVIKFNEDPPHDPPLPDPR